MKLTTEQIKLSKQVFGNPEEDTVTRVLKLKLEGSSIKATADALGITYSYVNQILCEARKAAR